METKKILAKICSKVKGIFAFPLIFLSLGEIGGNMGLFLGCSLLTICEFFDFLISFLNARNRRVTHP